VKGNSPEFAKKNNFVVIVTV